MSLNYSVQSSTKKTLLSFSPALHFHLWMASFYKWQHHKTNCSLCSILSPYLSVKTLQNCWRLIQRMNYLEEALMHPLLLTAHSHPLNSNWPMVKRRQNAIKRLYPKLRSRPKHRNLILLPWSRFKKDLVEQRNLNRTHNLSRFLSSQLYPRFKKVQFSSTATSSSRTRASTTCSCALSRNTSREKIMTPNTIIQRQSIEVARIYQVQILSSRMS